MIGTAYTFGNTLTGTPAVHLNGITHTVNGQSFWAFGITRSLLGQIGIQQGAGALANQNSTETFSYDNRGRLIAETELYQSSAQNTKSNQSVFTYDLSNNLEGGNGLWSYNGSNQVTSAPYVSGATSLTGGTGLAYDLSGNLSAFSGSTLTWDRWGCLAGISASPNVSFTYDSAGRRVSKTVGGVTTYYLYVGGALVAEVNASGTITRSYNWGPLGLISDAAAGVSRFYLFDALGNTRFLLNSSGAQVSDADYTAYSAPCSNSFAASPFAWKGQFGAYRDAETGLVLMGARYYSPALGRFISRDPSGFASGPNVYSYCMGDPANFFDPDGCRPADSEGPFWYGTRWLSEFFGDNDVAYHNGRPRGDLNFGKSLPGLLIDAHDSWARWGEVEGSAKASPGGLMEARWAAATSFAHAALAGSMTATSAMAGPEPTASGTIVPLYARHDGIISETLAGHGEITSAYTLTADEALETGIEYLGEGYREIGKPNSGTYRSADGLRQFRIDKGSLLGNHRPYLPHVHFERYEPGGRFAVVNNHVPIKE